MAQDKVQIDKAHARIFARAIYKDIAAYVHSHQKEYQKYLKEEERKKDDQTSHRHNSV